MKGKAFLEKINKQGKINNEDFNKVLETFPDIELPDVWVNLFEENFLTRERATADFEITKRIKAESLNGVDEKLKGVIALLDAKDKEEVEKEVNTYKKVELLHSAIPRLLEKVKGNNPTTDEKVKELEKTNQELVEKIKIINTESENKVKSVQKEFDEKERGMKVDWTLDKELLKYTFADEFTGIKEAILKGILSDVKGKNTLALDDKGQILVQEIVNGAPKQKFNGNDPVTIDSLLAEPLKPFLKKNNKEGDGSQQQQQQTRTRTHQATDTIDPGKATLSERRKLAAQNATV
jgi:hypothetical protein